MRSVSFLLIVVLCVMILAIDILAFYWLQSITRIIHVPFIQTGINVAFWIFSFALITAILVLKLRLSIINPRRKQFWISSLYGLSISSFLPKLIFVIVISILYFSNYIFSESESIWVVPLIGLFSGFLPFAVILFGIFKTLYRFKLHTVSIEHPNLPASFNSTKIIHISDLHLGSFNYRYHILDRAIKMINHQEADFIFFTGDLVNNYAFELNGWQDVLRQLHAKKGKFAVLGNHDYGDYSHWQTDGRKAENFELIKKFFVEIDFKLLLNESERIQKEQSEIAIIGVENWGLPPFKQYGDLEKALKDVTSVPFKILLSHDPSHWREEVVGIREIALTLSGHTHGMQAGIDFRNTKWSPIKYKYKEWLGLYVEGNQYLYVNRGLGWLGFPGRLGVRPEITLIELSKSS